MIHNSLWNKNIKSYPTLTKDINCDVLIIGTGLSGMSTAYYLAKNGKNVIVVDKGKIGGGASGNTTAHVTIQHDLIYSYYLKKLGLDKTKMIAHANLEALEEIKRIISLEKIECDLEDCNSTLTTNIKKNINRLNKEYNAYKLVGINAYYTEGYDNISFIKGLTITNQLHFNPIKYLNGLANAVLDNGGYIYQDTHILKIKDNYAYTDFRKINFNKVVIATHCPIINFPGMYFTKMYQERSYTISFIDTCKINNLYNSIDNNGYTFRPYKDYILMGGNDHSTGKKTHINHQEMLVKKAKQTYNEPTITNSWHAQDGTTIDNLPYIGFYNKKNKDMYVITGFRKWGMSNSNIAGRIISDLIIGNHNEYADIYSPQRQKDIKSILKLIHINLVVIKDYALGLLRIKAPRCSHLKCKTKYNKYTRSYDCPCHGSRFNKSGECIDSPAIHKIE